MRWRRGVWLAPALVALACGGGTFVRAATCVGEPCKRDAGKLECRNGPY